MAVGDLDSRSPDIPPADARLTDILPSELSCDYTSAALGGATGHTSGSGDLNETLILPADSSVTYTVTCDVAIDATDTLVNNAMISSMLTDPVPANNTATDDDTRLRIADLSIAQTDTPDPVLLGALLAYTLQVTNSGLEPAEDVRVTALLPLGATLHSTVGNDWICNGMGSIVICGLDILSVGSAPPLINVKTPLLETFLQLLTIVSTVELDPNLDNNSSAETTFVTNPLFSDGFESGDVLL